MGYFLDPDKQITLENILHNLLAQSYHNTNDHPLLDQTSVYRSPNKNRNIAMRTYRVSIILAWSLSYYRTRKYNVRKSNKLIFNSNVRSMYEKAIISEFGLYFTYCVVILCGQSFTLDRLIILYDPCYLFSSYVDRFIHDNSRD